MKYTKFLYILLAVVLIQTACDDNILDLKNPNAYDTGTFFTKANEIQGAANATYSGLYFAGLFCRDYYFIFDLLGNDAVKTANMEGDVIDFASYTFTATNGTIGLYWHSLYRIIMRANLTVDKGEEFLTNGGKSESDIQLVNRSVAEAKFLKAWAYFELVTSFGRVPVKKSLADLDVIETPRSEVAEIWTYIETLLTEAAAALPETYARTEAGRATSSAAYALLGKSYLFQKKYPEAITAFEKVKGGLLPLAQYDWNFSDQDNEENSVESVFQVQFKYIPGSGQWGYDHPETGSGIGACHNDRALEYGYNDWWNVSVSEAVASQFRYNDPANQPYDDPRGPLTFYGSSDYATGDMTVLDLTGSPQPYDNSFGITFRKYQNYERIAAEGGPRGSNNINIIRYADVLLMHAEALIMNNNVSAGMNLINDVRARVGAFAWTGITDQTSAMKKLKHERVLELTGEQVRFKDLIRWGEAKQVLNVELAAQYGPGTYFQDKHVLLPIPIEEINTNKAVANDIKDNWN